MNPDPAVLVAWMDRIISHEASLGIFILCIFSAPSHIDTFTNLPSTRITALGFEDLQTLGRGFLGVGGVPAALAWADAAGESGPGGHTLAVLYLLLANDEYGALTRKTLKDPRLFGMDDALIRSVVSNSVYPSYSVSSTAGIQNSAPRIVVALLYAS